MKTIIWDFIIFLGRAGVATLLGGVLIYYLNEKLKGEITKDIETIKGGITENIERLKGSINKDIEEFKSSENKANIVGSRYVEVVANQRILWLEKIREDVSQIVGLTRLIFFQDELINNYMNTKLMQVMLDKNYIDANGKDIIFEEYKNKLYEKNTGISELLQVITKLKLRLNYKEDTTLLKLLGKIEEGIITKINQNDMKTNLSELVSLSQVLLKDEWEKVKSEVMAGKEEKQ